jgi:PAS domain S-box-containing protein
MKMEAGGKHEALKMRRYAEQRLSSSSEIMTDHDLDEKRLLHELHVHKIELEMQVEALKEARTLAEQSLSLAVRAQESYVELFDFAPMAYFTIGRDANILSLNIRAKQLLGLERSQNSGLSFADNIAPEFRIIFKRFLENVFSGRERRCELSLLSGEKRRWVSIEAAADFSGQTCLAAVLDITEQKLNQQGAQLAATVYAALREAIMVTDNQNRIISINPAFTRLTGYNEQDAVGQYSTLLKSGQQDEAYYRSMWDSLNSAGRWEGEIYNLRKNGDVCSAWLSISTVYGDQGEVKLRVAIYFDLAAKQARKSGS